MKKQQILNLLKDFIFPNICICEKWGEVLCTDCYTAIPKNKTQLCPMCKRISEYGKTCDTCRHKSYLTGVMIFGKHEGLLKKIVWNYKYELYRDLSAPISKMLADKFGVFIKKKKFIVTSVPNTKERMIWRGFNQAAEVAESLSTRLNIQYTPLFTKKNTLPQVGLSRKERLSNLRDKIHLLTDELNGSIFLIVDDVYTTGSTLEECAKELRKAGAKEVWGLVITRE